MVARDHPPSHQLGGNSVSTKTGGQNTTWVDLERPKPPRVDDHYRYWSEPPPERSERCAYWLRQIDRGWRPNRFLRRECCDCSAEWYGVYVWEYLNEISPRLSGGT